MAVTFKQLEAFYWTAQLGSLTAAAARINVTQSTVSARMAELEAELAAKLFQRGPRGLRLTARGRELEAHAEQALALSNRIQRGVGAPTALGGQVRIGAADSIALTWLPRLLHRLMEAHPRIAVEVMVDLSMHLWERLADGALDLAFLAGTPVRPYLEARALGHLSYGWMAGPALIGRPREMTAAELAGHPIIVTHARASHLMVLVQGWFRAQGVRPGRIIGCNSMATVIELTRSGLGIGVFPPSLVADDLARGRIVALRTPMPLPRTDFVAAFPADATSAATAAVVDLAVEVAGGHPAFNR